MINPEKVMVRFKDIDKTVIDLNAIDSFHVRQETYLKVLVNGLGFCLSYEYAPDLANDLQLLNSKFKIHESGPTQLG